MPKRPPFRNDARRVLLVTLLALGLFVALELALRRSREFSPDFLASVLLYGLTVLNLGLLLVLLTVLGRNVVRVLVERRQGILGARFRARLVSVFLIIATGPSILIVVVGSDLIQQTVDRWFSVDVERLLSSSQALGKALQEEHLDRCTVAARLLVREVEARGLLEPSGQGRLRRTVELRARELGLDLVGVFSRQGEVVAVLDPRLAPTLLTRDSGAALAESALGSGELATQGASSGTGEWVRAAVPLRSGGEPWGAVVVSSHLPAGSAAEIREMEERYTKLHQAEASRGPIKAVYLSFYFFAALLVLFGAVWLSLYMARRITQPLRLVALGAERIAAGERGYRVDFPAADDEFAALVDSFNRMSERLARSEEEVEASRQGLQRKNHELEERRRLTETVLETVGTGILVVDAEGTLTAANAAASRLLDLVPEAVGRPLASALPGPGRTEVVSWVERLLSGRVTRQERELNLSGSGRDRHLSVTVVPLAAAGGGVPGAVVLLDDLTPLMRAQKVAAWGEVARKLAHEIKNPLTPIQLSAQRIRKAQLKGSPDLPRVIEECTGLVVREVEALKNLVDEFAHFARLPPTRLRLASLHEVVEQTLSLYEGLPRPVTIEARLAPEVPPLRLDPDQMKRALINLIDNAIEALEGPGAITVATELDRAAGRARLVVSDDGPGVAAADRERLFVPDFSTKRRGSGLGLSIVSRIVQEHQGQVRVEENQPRGARFVVDLPLA